MAEPADAAEARYLRRLLPSSAQQRPLPRPPPPARPPHQLLPPIRPLPSASSPTSPAAAELRATPDSASPSPSTTAVAQQKRPRARLHQAIAACVACRKRKAKCSGDRPRCNRCVQKRIECQFVTEPGETNAQALKRNLHHSRSKAADQEELIRILKSLPEPEAQDVLQKLRFGIDATSLVNQIRAGDVRLQMHVIPETCFRYDFPYGSEIPAALVSDNPYLNSMLFEATSLFSTDAVRPGPLESSLFARLGSDDPRSVYLKPFHAADVVDSLLADVRPSAWTAVCTDDMLMRELLTVFFRCEYHFTAAFQKDLFLEDMASGKKDFCSSLLVNAVLAYCCVCHERFSTRSEYWNPMTLQYRFMAEAKRLWELEANHARITNVQAGIIFSVYHNLCGLDEIGQPYRIHAIHLSHKLRLFNTDVDVQDTRLRRGRAYAAWALYNWETLIAFSFLFVPLLRTPPEWPLPDPSEHTDFYGEVWMKYPLVNSLSPSYFGHVFKARSLFRIIMNEYCQAAFLPGPGVTLKTATTFHRRLQEWHDALPGPLQPSKIVLPGHLQLHMYYQHLMLAIFEPVLGENPQERAHLQPIIATAKKHLQTLFRLYYLRHGYGAMDLFVSITLMIAASECVGAINDDTPPNELDDLRSTLLLATKGLYEQSHNNYVAEALYKVIRGRMRPQEVALMRNSIDLAEDESRAKKEMLQAVRSHWPVGVVKRKEDLNEHILGNLVENYARLNVS